VKLELGKCADNRRLSSGRSDPILGLQHSCRARLHRTAERGYLHVSEGGSPHIRKSVFVIGAIFALPLLCFAAKQFSMPKVQPAFSYPARDHHGNENVTVGLDPYDTPTKASIFTIHYRENELLPILVVITNDSEQPVQLSDMKVELVTADRTKLTPLSEEDIFRRISHPKASGTRYPVPFPTQKAKGGVDSKSRDEVQSALFRARAVEPRSSQVGFMFFDISDLSNPLSGASLYLTGVRDSSGHDLMYFEISLDKYLESAKQH
jgi:hypothetical protein